MDLKITLTDRQAEGLTKVTAAFNERQGPSDNLTPDQYAANELSHLANGWADLYDVAKTGDIAYLKKQVQADPLAVKAALDAASPVVSAEPLLLVSNEPPTMFAKAKAWLGLV